MRVLLVNKFYYPRGGDCIYTIELEKLLASKGNDVALFSMHHPSNLTSKYESYFPSHIDFNRRSLKGLISLLVRPFGASEVRGKFTQLLDDFRPDVVHLNNIHSQLSPVIAFICQKKKIPVVWTLHDYKLVCPAYLFLSNGKPCEACLEKKWSVIRKRCIKNNLYASLVAYFEARHWNSSKLDDLTARFISPSKFLKDKMVQGGFNSDKITVLHNFVNAPGQAEIQETNQSYYCYVGRLSSEKGIKTLLEAASALGVYNLKIIGTGPMEEELIAGNRMKHVEFMGHRTGVELRNLIAGSKFLVLPSEVYENNPLTILEALWMGVPVLGSNMGGIPELIMPGLNGLLFEAGNVQDMRSKIENLWQNNNQFLRNEISHDAQLNYSSERYYEKLSDIYKSAVHLHRGI